MKRRKKGEEKEKKKFRVGRATQGEEREEQTRGGAAYVSHPIATLWD